MVEFKIKSDGLKALGKSLNELLRDFPQAEARALNRTADSVRTAGVRAIAANIGIPQKAVREALFVRHAVAGTSAVTGLAMQASVQASGKRIPLIDLNARQTRKGVSYRLGQRRVLAGSFIAKMRSGHTGVFKRRAKSRLPIDELKGPSIPIVFVRKKIQEVMINVVAERLPTEIARQLGYYMSKAS